MPPSSPHRQTRKRIGAGAYPATIGLLLLLLPGCAAVGPDYTAPSATPPAAWHSLADQERITVAATASEELARWWTVFNDPVLTGLIEKAAVGNTDLRQAQARVREARARVAPGLPLEVHTVARDGSHIEVEIAPAAAPAAGGTT